MTVILWSYHKFFTFVFFLEILIRNDHKSRVVVVHQDLAVVFEAVCPHPVAQNVQKRRRGRRAW